MVVVLSLGALAVATSLTGTSTAGGQLTGDGHNLPPNPVTRNSIVFDGVEIASFSRCVGPHLNIVSPGEPGAPGTAKGTLVCERVADNKFELDAWMAEV